MSWMASLAPAIKRRAQERTAPAAQVVEARRSAATDLALASGRRVPSSTTSGTDVMSTLGTQGMTIGTSGPWVPPRALRGTRRPLGGQV